jgi:hypothetical protein
MAFPLIRARYRVLLLKDIQPANPEFPVLAICIEQNIVGRGRTEPEALLDLNRTFLETVHYQVENLAPAPVEDADPALLAAFGDPSQKTLDGDVILDRFQMLIETVLQPSASQPRRRGVPRVPTQRVIYEPCRA